MSAVSVVPPRGAPTSAMVVTAPHAPGGPRMSGHSTTESGFEIGEHVFAVDSFSQIYQQGTRLRLTARGKVEHWIEGVANDFDYDTNTLKIIVDYAAGTGTFDDWIINVVGQPGPQGQRGERGEKGDLGLLGGETGPDGPAGARGPAGDRGPKGAQATIEIGATTTLAEGSQASVTNSGISGAAILNFNIPGGGPAGPTGDKGATGDPGVDGDDVMLHYGTRAFTGKVSGIAPSVTANDATLTPASWVRDRIASYVAALGNRVPLSMLDDYARLDGAAFTGPVKFMTGPPPTCADTPVIDTHALWHDGLITWEDKVVGYIVFPNKFMIQWGLITGGGGDLWVTFPDAFTVCYGVWILPTTNAIDHLFGHTVGDFSAYNFLACPRYIQAGFVGPGSHGFFWLAIGHRK